MLAQDDLKWLAATSTELNTVLQQLVRHVELACRHAGGQNADLEALSEKVEMAARTSQALFDGVTSRIFASARPTVSSKAIPTASSPELPTEIKVKNPNGSREFVLLIDDEPEIAEYASELLADEGYRLITAHDGFEALDIFRKIHDKIGLVVLDYFLPVMNGDAVFEELREINARVAVMLSSGFNEQNKVNAMLKQGLRGFIPKPYTREKLLDQVGKAIRGAKSLAA